MGYSQKLHESSCCRECSAQRRLSGAIMLDPAHYCLYKFLSMARIQAHTNESFVQEQPSLSRQAVCSPAQSSSEGSTHDCLKREELFDLGANEIISECSSPFQAMLRVDSFQTLSPVDTNDLERYKQCGIQKIRSSSHLDDQKQVSYESRSYNNSFLCHHRSQVYMGPERQGSDSSTVCDPGYFRSRVDDYKNSIRQRISATEQQLLKLKRRRDLNQSQSRHEIGLLEERMNNLKQSHLLPSFLKSQSDQSNIQSTKEAITSFNDSYTSLLSQLQATSKVNVVGETGSLMQRQIQMQLKEVQTCSMAALHVQNNQTQFVYPVIESKGFEVEDFDMIRSQGKEIITEPFSTKYNRWRLKIYPSGYISAKSAAVMREVEYLSIYVEMLDGVLESSKFLIRVELAHQNQPGQSISKQFESHFQKNQSWGYDRYTKVANLYARGLITDRNSILIKVSIRHLNHQQTDAVSRHIITHREAIHSANEQTIQLLKAKLAKLSQQSQVSNARLHHSKIRSGQISLQQSPSKIIRLVSCKNTHFINQHLQKAKFF